MDGLYGQSVWQKVYTAGPYRKLIKAGQTDVLNVWLILVKMIYLDLNLQQIDGIVFKEVIQNHE